MSTAACGWRSDSARPAAGACLGLRIARGRSASGPDPPPAAPGSLARPAAAPQPSAEPDGLAQMARPVAGVGRLARRQPGAGDVGEAGRRRRARTLRTASARNSAMIGSIIGRVEGAARCAAAGSATLAGAARPPARRPSSRPGRTPRTGVGALTAATPSSGGEQRRRPLPPAAARPASRRAAARSSARPRSATSASASSRVNTPGEAGRDVLADAVADHRRGPHAPAHPQPGQRVLDHEERRLASQAAELAVRRLAPAVAAGCSSGGRRSRPRCGARQLGAAVDRLAEDRLGLVQLAAHAGVLRALPGEHEDHRPVAARRATPVGPPARVAAARQRLRAVRQQHERGGGGSLAPDLQGVGDVGQVERGRPARLAGCRRRRLARLERGRRCAADSDQQLPGPRGPPDGAGAGASSSIDVGVGAADAERADAGAPRRGAASPASGPPGVLT